MIDEDLDADVRHVLLANAATAVGGAQALAELAGPGVPTVSRVDDVLVISWPSGWHFAAPEHAVAVVVGMLRGRRDARKAAMN